MEKRNQLSEIMSLAWQFVKRNGMNMSEALKAAWKNIKLKAAMKLGIVKFYFQKVEAYGTLREALLPATQQASSRKANPTTQTYYDTEKQEWRCFKKANLIY